MVEKLLCLTGPFIDRKGRESKANEARIGVAGISAILKWTQTCVVNQPVLSSNSSGEPNISHFEILSGLLVNEVAQFIGKNRTYCQRAASLRLVPSSADLLGQGAPAPIPGETLRVSVDRCAFG